MPTLTVTFDYQTDAQRLALEQALAYFHQLNHTAATAECGAVLATCERLALQQGREVLRSTLQAALQTRAADVDDAQKKCPAPAPRAPTPAGS